MLKKKKDNTETVIDKAVEPIAVEKKTDKTECLTEKLIEKLENKLTDRIDRIVSAISKSKSVKGM